MGSISGLSMGGGSWFLPDWLAIAWTLAFFAVFVAHCHHLLSTRGQRRAWHCVHVVMALSMALMYVPLDSVGHVSIVWRDAFAVGTVVVLTWLLMEVARRRAINGLWVLAAADLAAMAYMWSPGGIMSPTGWIVAAYFTVQAALWMNNSYRWLDDRLRFGGMLVNSAAVDHSISVAAEVSAESLMARLHLRASMITMTLGMAYMLAAMQYMR